MSSGFRRKSARMASLLPLVVCSLLSTGTAQWSQTSIMLPDSLGIVTDLYSTVWDSLGDRVFVGGRGGVMAFDCATNERLAFFPATGMVTALCHNTAGHKVYFADDATGMLSIVDGGSLERLATVGVGGGPFGLCYDRQSNRVYCAGCGGQLAVIDGAKDAVISVIALPRNSQGVCVGTRDRKVYCASHDNCVSVVDIATDQLDTTVSFGDHSLPYAPVCYNSTDNKVYCLGTFRNGRGVAIVDCTTDSLLDTVAFGGADPLTLCYNPLRNKVYCGNYYVVNVIDGATNQVLSTIDPGTSCFTGMSYCTQYDRVYVTSLHSVVIAIDCAADTVLSLIDAGGEPTDLCYSSRANRLYAPDPVCDHVSVVDPEANAVVARVRSRELPYALCFVPETGKLYCASNSLFGCISVVDAATNAVLARVEAGGSPSALCYSSQMEKVYCANSDCCYVTVIDAKADTVLATVTAGTSPRALCYNWHDDKVYCANALSSNLTVIDCRDDSALTTIPVGRGGYQALCYNSRDSKVYCLSADGQLTVLDGATDSVVFDDYLGSSAGAICYVPSSNRVYCAVWRPGASRVVVLDGRSDEVVWEVGVGTRSDAICYNTQEGKAYVASYDNAVAVVSALSHRVVKVILTGTRSRQLCYDSLDNAVLCLSRDSGTVVVIDCATDSVVASVHVGLEPRDMVWNPIQNRVYVANSASSSISVLWDSVAAAADTLRPRATIVHSVIYLPRLPASARYPLYSVGGRKATDLSPGANDVSALPAGVYFCTLATGEKRTTRKIVVTE